MARPMRTASLLALFVAAGLALGARRTPQAPAAPASPAQDFEAGFASITEKELLVHVSELAAPQLEGRDSPSDGLHRAGEYIIGRLQAAGVEPGMPDGSYRHGYTLERNAPVPEQCTLVLVDEEGVESEFVLEQDFVPFPSCAGEGEGRLVFFGFGITDSGERYDDLQGKNCEGEVVVILEGEPRHKKLFDGPEVTKAADSYTKIKAIEQRGARGVLIVRRPPAEEPKGLDGKVVAPTELGFRHTWARWNHPGLQADTQVNTSIPVLEISMSVATRLLGQDVAELAARIDTSGKPIKLERKGVRVRLSAGMAERPVPIDNIVGLVRGSDAALAGEYLVLGAHYDHIGVDAWGRIGCGADDNGSGSAGLIELAEAMVLAKPKRSILVAWFSAEEDGLDGSKAFCERPPVAMQSIAAMLNVDMIGRCAEYEVFVVGAHVNKSFEDVLKQAKKLKPTQLKKVHTDKALDLWHRSDHFNFHEKGVPTMFFTEGAVDAENPDYHVFTDTVDKLSLPKMGRITRFLFNTAWLIANEPERPPAPR
jgi:hypothetical protein